MDLEQAIIQKYILFNNWKIFNSYRENVENGVTEEFRRNKTAF